MSVTTDWAVAHAMSKVKKNKDGHGAADVASACGLSGPFAITARLKGMEERGLMSRNQAGRWFLTESGRELGTGPEPKEAPKPVRAPRLPGQPVAPPPSDDDVERIRNTRGWRLSYVWRQGSARERVDIFTSPEGTRYVEAMAQEKCDFIFISRFEGIRPVRLKHLEDSAIFRHIERSVRETEARAEAKSNRKEA